MTYFAVRSPKHLSWNISSLRSLEMQRGNYTSHSDKLLVEAFLSTRKHLNSSEVNPMLTYIFTDLHWCIYRKLHTKHIFVSYSLKYLYLMLASKTCTVESLSNETVSMTSLTALWNSETLPSTWREILKKTTLTMDDCYCNEVLFDHLNQSSATINAISYCTDQYFVLNVATINQCKCDKVFKALKCTYNFINTSLLSNHCVK